MWAEIRQTDAGLHSSHLLMCRSLVTNATSFPFRGKTRLLDQDKTQLNANISTLTVVQASWVKGPDRCFCVSVATNTLNLADMSQNWLFGFTTVFYWSLRQQLVSLCVPTTLESTRRDDFTDGLSRARCQVRLDYEKIIKTVFISSPLNNMQII